MYKKTRTRNPNFEGSYWLTKIFGTKWGSAPKVVFEVYLVDRVCDSDRALDLYVIDDGKFFGGGRFGAALKFGTELAGCIIQTIIAVFAMFGGFRARE